MIRKDALPEDFWSAALLTDYAHRVAPTLAIVFKDGGSEAIDDSELGISFDFLEPNALQYGQERGAELIGMKNVNGQWVDNPKAEWAIDATTRETARELLTEAMEEGMSVQDFADRLEESGLFGEARAEMIARTETALAFAGGKVASYREADVDYVYIYDGDYDEECAARDGTIVSIDEYADEPILHPNCVADARPATRSELAEEGLLDESDDNQDEEAA